MTIQTIEQHVDVYIKWLKAHEKLIVVAVIAAFLFHFGEKGMAAWEAHDKRNADLAQQQLAVVTADNKLLDNQLKTLQAQVAAAQATADAAIKLSHQKTQDQQKKDEAMPLPELAVRWSNVLDLPPADFTANKDNTITVNDEAAHSTVVELEKIPDLTETVVQTEAKLAGCNAVVAKQTEDITGKDAEIAAVNKARVEDAKVAKDAQRHAGRKWFKTGFITGAAVVVAAILGVKIATGSI